MAVQHIEYDPEIAAGPQLPVVDRSWQPHAVHFKLNCSSIWSKPSYKVAMCVIARAPDRRVLFADCEIGVATSAPEAEAKACLLGLRLAAERLPGPFVMESDFFYPGFSAFEAFGASLTPSVTELITRCRQMNLQWSKCKRPQNRTAVTIARLAFEGQLDGSWRERLVIIYD